MATHTAWHYGQRSWRVPLVRSALLGLLGHWSGGLGRLVGLPWAVWGWQVFGVCWPWLPRQAEWRAVRRLGQQAEHLALLWALTWPLSAGLQRLAWGQWSFTWDLPTMNIPWALGACVVCGSEMPNISTYVPLISAAILGRLVFISGLRQALRPTACFQFPMDNAAWFAERREMTGPALQGRAGPMFG